MLDDKFISSLKSTRISIAMIFFNFLYKVPEEFLWSEWGIPDKLCDVGIQQRTTMCGSLRRRLPNKVGRDSDDPAGNVSCICVYLPNKITGIYDLMKIGMLYIL